MPSFSFEVEYAKSNRAACKKCKSKIDKDVVRLGFKQEVPEDAEGASAHFGCSWHHFGCFPTAKGANWFKKHLLPEGDEKVVGLDALKPEDRSLVLTLLKACRGEVAVPESPGGGDSAAPTPVATPKAKGKKRQAEEGSADKNAKAIKVLTEEQVAAIAEAKGKLLTKNAAYLQAILAKNGLPKSGKKDELVDRAAECQVLGVPPQCPCCEKKKLVWSRETGKFSCPGFFDDEAKRFKRCKGPEDGASLERTTWEELMN